MPSTDECKLLEDFADKFITCSLKNPLVKKTVEEVNKHHHTRTCTKHGTSCRFYYPKFPSLRTILAIPLRLKYPDLEEREIMKEKVKLMLGRVKEVLENKEYMEEICKIREKEINDYVKNKEFIERAESFILDPKYSSKIKKIQFDSLTNDMGLYLGKKTSKQKPLGETLLENLDNLKAYYSSLINENNFESWMRERLLKLLEISKIAELLNFDPDLLIYDKPKYEQDLINKYEESLSISFRGFTMIHKRDVDEIFINNYNKEWIHCWDSNMDIQITLDFYAIITYISDYYMKDDTGTMEFLKAAIKDTENESFKEKLKKLKNTFLTHRQMGEAEAYYRLFPSFHLSDSNAGTIFVHTGLKKSHFLKKLSEDEMKKTPESRLIDIPNREGFFYRNIFNK